MVGKQITQPVGEGFLCEQAAATGTRIVLESPLAGQGLLWPTAATLNIQQLFAVDQTPLFDRDDGQQFGA